MPVRFVQIADEMRAQVPEALEAGARHVLAKSQELVPKESGDLAASGDVEMHGDLEAVIAYHSVYARWIHEHLGFHHPRGGQAKFLEQAMVVDGEDAINIVARRLRGAG